MVVGGSPYFLHDIATRVRANVDAEAEACGELGTDLRRAEVTCGHADLAGALAELGDVVGHCGFLAPALVEVTSAVIEANARALDRAFGGGAE